MQKKARLPGPRRRGSWRLQTAAGGDGTSRIRVPVTSGDRARWSPPMILLLLSESTEKALGLKAGEVMGPRATYAIIINSLGLLAEEAMGPQPLRPCLRELSLERTSLLSSPTFQVHYGFSSISF